MYFLVLTGGIIGLVSYVLYSTLLHPPPLAGSTVSEDAGIEPRTVATSVMAVGSSNHSAIRSSTNVFPCFILFFIQHIIPGDKSLSTVSYLKEQCHEIFEVLFVNHLRAPENPSIAIWNFIRKLKIFLDQGAPLPTGINDTSGHIFPRDLNNSR